MTTTELIKILQDNEKGGISHKPRNISLSINGRYMPDPQISLSSTGDGICGPEIDLDIEGEWFEQQPNRCNSCTHSEEQDGSNCYECVKGMADNFEAQPMDKCKGCYYNDGDTHAECVVCDKGTQPTDAVSREAMLSLHTEYAEKMSATTFWKLRDDIRALPPVTPERPKGKWINKYYMATKVMFKRCSECDYEYSYDAETGISDANYCPNCGAEMED